MIKDIEPGMQIDFSDMALSEEEIISYAKMVDPLDFHIDREAAEQSHFRGLVASGPHIFSKIYREEWVPRFGKTVLAGLEANNWKFLAPVYANKTVRSHVIVKDIRPNPEKGHAVVTWLYEFFDDEGQQLQTIETKVLHRLD